MSNKDNYKEDENHENGEEEELEEYESEDGDMDDDDIIDFDEYNQTHKMGEAQPTEENTNIVIKRESSKKISPNRKKSKSSSKSKSKEKKQKLSPEKRNKDSIDNNNNSNENSPDRDSLKNSDNFNNQNRDDEKKNNSRISGEDKLKNKNNEVIEEHPAEYEESHYVKTNQQNNIDKSIDKSLQNIHNQSNRSNLLNQMEGDDKQSQKSLNNNMNNLNILNNLNNSNNQGAISQRSKQEASLKNENLENQIKNNLDVKINNSVHSIHSNRGQNNNISNHTHNTNNTNNKNNIIPIKDNKSSNSKHSDKTPPNNNNNNNISSISNNNNNSKTSLNNAKDNYSNKNSSGKQDININNLSRISKKDNQSNNNSQINKSLVNTSQISNNPNDKNSQNNNQKSTKSLNSAQRNNQNNQNNQSNQNNQNLNVVIDTQENQDNDVNNHNNHNNHNAHNDYDSEGENYDQVIIDNENYTQKSNNNLAENKSQGLNLLDIDINNISKDDLVNMLLNNDYLNTQLNQLSKNPTMQTQSTNPNIKSKSNVNVLNKLSKVTKYGVNPQNIDFLTDFKDPEYIHDFNTAFHRVTEKMAREIGMSEGNDNQSDLMRILLNDKDKERTANMEDSRVDISKNYEEKNKMWIERKNRNIEIISEKLREDFQKNHTFAPQINVGPQNNSYVKRNLDQFLQDQEMHIKKTQEKLNHIKFEKQKLEVKDYQKNPTINENSKKIIEEKYSKDDEPVYDRLYKRKQAKLDTKDGKLELKDNLRMFSPQQKVVKLSSNEIAEKANRLYIDANKRKLKLEELTKKFENEEKRNMIQLQHVSQKFMLRKFVKQYKSELQKIVESDECKIKNKLSLFQLVSFFHNMKFVTEKELVDYVEKNVNSDEETQQNIISIASSVSLNKSTIKKKEQQLIFKIFDLLKNHDGLVDIEPLFLFLLSLLKLYEYYMIKCYSKRGNNENNNNGDPNISDFVSNPLLLSESSKTLKKKDLQDENTIRERNEILSKKIEEDLKNKIKSMRKYIGIDDHDHIIITFEQAKLINKDFNQLYMNWSNYDGSSKLNNKKSKKSVEVNETFKPKISDKSRELYLEYRKKMFTDAELSNKDRLDSSHVYSMDGKELEAKDYSIVKSQHNNQHNNSQLSNARPLSPRNDANLQYINMMILKKQRKDKQNEMINQENERKKLDQCTFKPKTNKHNFVSNREPVSQDSSGINLEQRIEMLYKKGTACYKNKRDKDKDEIIFEKERNEFTFKPNINDAFDQNILKTNLNSNYNYRDAEKMYERLRNGRIVYNYLIMNIRKKKLRIV